MSNLFGKHTGLLSLRFYIFSDCYPFTLEQTVVICQRMFFYCQTILIGSSQ